MKEVIGDIWDFWNGGNWVVIPTNGSLDRKGALVMGAGLAKEAKEKDPGIEMELGDIRKKTGLRVVAKKKTRMIFLPTKYQWHDKMASIGLIKRSLKELRKIADKDNLTAVYLPRIGCGLGRLQWSQVKGILEKILDDRFTVVERKMQ